MHLDEERRDGSSFFLQSFDLFPVKLVECNLVNVDVFVTTCFEEHIVCSSVPVLVAHLLYHFLDLQKVEVQVVADSAFLPLPCKALTKQANVNFLSTLVVKGVECLSNLSICLSIRQTLSLVKNELNFFGHFVSTKYLHNLLCSFQESKGNGKIFLSDLGIQCWDVKLYIFQLLPCVGLFLFLRDKDFSSVCRYEACPSVPISKLRCFQVDIVIIDGLFLVIFYKYHLIKYLASQINN